MVHTRTNLINHTVTLREARGYRVVMLQLSGLVYMEFMHNCVFNTSGQYCRNLAAVKRIDLPS